MDSQEKEKLGFLNLLIVILSIYVLLSLLVDTFFKLPIEISKLLFTIDNGICLVFLLDFFIRFFRADNKLKFMKWGWIDLVSSIPSVDILRAGRLIRLFRLLRLIAVVLMVTGVGLFGVFTGYISSIFVSERKNEKK